MAAEGLFDLPAAPARQEPLPDPIPGQGGLFPVAAAVGATAPAPAGRAFSAEVKRYADRDRMMNRTHRWNLYGHVGPQQFCLTGFGCKADALRAEHALRDGRDIAEVAAEYHVRAL